MLSLIKTFRRLTGSLRLLRTESIPASAPKTGRGVSSAEEDINQKVGGASFSTWGTLQISREIASGSFGSVYEAWDPALARLVALKLYPPGEGTTFDSKVVEEGRLLARLNHDNIVKVHWAGIEEGRVGLWMELVRGQSLAKIVEAQGPMSAREAALIGLDLCHALAAVHAAGLLHRDIKAQNVMREPGGRIVLIDFGLGEERRPENFETSHELAGTPFYMAPELFEGERATVRSEVYALGVLLFYLVTGRYPVEAETLEELHSAHRNSSRVSLGELRPGLPKDFAAVLERAIAENPQERFRSVADVAAKLAGNLSLASARKRLTAKIHWRATAGACLGLLALGGTVRWWVTRPIAGVRPIVWVTETIAPPGQPEYAGLTIALREEIARSDSVRKFDMGQVPLLLERMALSPTTPLTGRTRRQVAFRGDVSYIVDSTVLQVGEDLRLKVVVESLGPSSVFAADKSEREFPFDAPTSAPKVVRSAAAWIRQIAREPLSEIAMSGEDTGEVTTGNLTALSHYLRAEKLHQNREREAAIAEWRAALRIDPDFLQAHTQLAGTLQLLHKDMESLQEYAEAYRLLGKRQLGIRESYRIRAAFVSDTGDILGGDAIHAEWLSRFPDDEEAMLKRAYPLLATGRVGEALAVLNRAKQLNPNRRTTRYWLAAARIVAGNLDRVKEETDRLRALGDVDTADLIDANVLFLQGKHSRAWALNRAVYDRTRGKPTLAIYRIRAALRAAAMWAEMGKAEVARDVLERDLAPLESMGSPSDIAKEWSALARVRMLCGDSTGGAQAAKFALQLEVGPRTIIIAAPILVRSGHPELALEFLKEFENSIPTAEARHWNVSLLPRLLVEGEILYRAHSYRSAFLRFRRAAALEVPEAQREYIIRTDAALRDKQAALAAALSAASLGPFLWSEPDSDAPGAWSESLAYVERFCSDSSVAIQHAAECKSSRRQLEELRDPNNIPII